MVAYFTDLAPDLDDLVFDSRDARLLAAAARRDQAVLDEVTAPPAARQPVNLERHAGSGSGCPPRPEIKAPFIRASKRILPGQIGGQNTVRVR